MVASYKYLAEKLSEVALMLGVCTYINAMKITLKLTLNLSMQSFLV